MEDFFHTIFTSEIDLEILVETYFNSGNRTRLDEIVYDYLQKRKEEGDFYNFNIILADFGYQIYIMGKYDTHRLIIQFPGTEKMHNWMKEGF